ncbi:hypothetical protein PICMEDRAFT_73718 [Pichia membranifaciens NRRL Y-2026]|uniref:Rhomboid-type serine protease 2 n=1 Tax=Pichia membranifaciens NRRL Y-2026 TaxID=763406 RepID=A0A1E3NHV5_9ASCO|nr:hypothetical protein PICMEDRAFT_73718 [Pichia membranifaciens NRRL Y-2026]ODQ44913.1 hypothetical protein PICMEDRAFT_73718 [Pichia membranifaciens NRRL Y-2026]
MQSRLAERLAQLADEDTETETEDRRELERLLETNVEGRFLDRLVQELCGACVVDEDGGGDEHEGGHAEARKVEPYDFALNDRLRTTYQHFEDLVQDTCQLRRDFVQSWALSPNSLIVEHKGVLLNAYPLVHESLVHLLFNVMVLHHTLSEFEVSHGSLHTAIILNTLGVVTGIAYTITEYILVQLGLANAAILDTAILGSSGWVFAFITAHCCLKSITSPTTNIYASYNIPTLLVPLFYLAVSAVLVPNSSFLGHLISIILGVLIFKDFFSLITIPPFQALDRIERLAIFKWGIRTFFPADYFVWSWEHEVKSSRYLESNFHSVSLPLHHGIGPGASTATGTDPVTGTGSGTVAESVLGSLANASSSNVNITDSVSNTNTNSNSANAKAATAHFEGPGEKLGSNL